MNIDGKGTAIRIAAGLPPTLYNTSDLITRLALQAHLYTFTFEAGTSVSSLSVRMLDFGDWNPQLSANHYASMTAYDINNVVVDTHVLEYTTPAVANPSSSNLYGNLQITGDAATATSGQPGNWTWTVTGSGIVKIVLEFGVGYDSNFGLDTLTFITECT